MKMRYGILAFICLLPWGLWSQDFNPPEEILRILEKSKVSYQVKMVTDQVGVPTPAGPENEAFTYAKEEDGQVSIATYDFDATTAPLYNGAEDDFDARNFAAARGKYMEIRELRPDIGVMCTFIGQTFDEEGNPTEAAKWYREAIEKDFHGYLAHWLLAEHLYNLKEYAQASEEIAIAWVLNRSSAEVRAAAAKIFKADKRVFSDADFVPNYRVTESGKDIQIEVSEDWMMYGFCKALWAYEPGYHRELGGGRGEFDMTQEKECLLNLAMGYSRIHKGKLGKDPMINLLMNAIDGKMVNEFIFMEEWLRSEPIIVFTQPKAAILSLAEYVLKIRAPKK